MTQRGIRLILALALSLAAAPAFAKPHACGARTCTTAENCEVCKTPMCEKRRGPNGKMVDAIVGTKTERTCTEAAAEAPAGGGRPPVGRSAGSAPLAISPGIPILDLPPGVTGELHGPVARMSDGTSFTCRCAADSCEESCRATRKGSQLSCSGSCKSYEEFQGCVDDFSTCGWVENGVTTAPRPSGTAGEEAGRTRAPQPSAPGRSAGDAH